MIIERHPAGWLTPFSKMVTGRELASEKRDPEENFCSETKVLLVEESYFL